MKDNKSPSLKQNSTKVSSIRPSSVKVKRNSRSLERSYSSSVESSHENVAQRRRRISKTLRRSQNKLSLKKERLSSAVQCDLLSDQQFSPRGKKSPSSIHSNTNLDSLKSKSYKKEMNQPSHTYEKFRKQDLISNKMPFSDFLTKESKTNSPKYQETGYTKTVSDSLISEWPAHNQTNINENVKLSANNSTKVESILQDISNSFSSYEKNCTNPNSMQEKCPRLFKKKKERISSDISSSSSSEYSFVPYNVKSCKSQANENASQLGYHIPYLSEINFTETSKNSKSKSASDNYQNNSMKWNSNGKLPKPVKKTLFSLNTKSQVESENQSEFSLKLSPTEFENDRTEDDAFLSCKMVPVIGKENPICLKKFTKASQHQHEKSFMDSGFTSNHVSQSSRKSDTYLGDWYQSTNQKNFSQSSGIFGNPYKKKRSWSCSSIGTCNESLSPFSSSLNSSRRVQVIVLPKETCEQHGLSASVKLLEVISLEDIKG